MAKDCWETIACQDVINRYINEFKKVYIKYKIRIFPKLPPQRGQDKEQKQCIQINNELQCTSL